MYNQLASDSFSSKYSLNLNYLKKLIYYFISEYLGKKKLMLLLVN